MKTLICAGALVLTATLLPAAVDAQTPAPSDGPGQFRFLLEESHTPRGKAVEGYIYNESPWRITNVRLRVLSVDPNGTVTNESSGWVVGDVGAGGRSYFYVPVPAHAASYRATVQSFDKVGFEGPRPEAP
jgi:hypothetical protein